MQIARFFIMGRFNFIYFLFSRLRRLIFSHKAEYHVLNLLLECLVYVQLVFKVATLPR